MSQTRGTPEPPPTPAIRVEIEDDVVDLIMEASLAQKRTINVIVNEALRKQLGEYFKPIEPSEFF